MAANPLDSGLPVGRRIQHFRERAGKTRAVVAGLLGKSASWLKAVETGRLLPPRLPDLVRIAEILGVRDITDLTGDSFQLPTDALTMRAHPALPAVRSALSTYALAETDTEPPDLDHLRERISFAWKARHASALHRTTLGDLLPSLIQDTQLAARAHEGAQRRQAQALLAEVLNLSTFYVAYQPAAALLWRATERAMAAALDSDDPRAVAMSAWSVAQAHRDTGDWDEAQAVTFDALAMLRPLLPDGPDELLGLWGSLQFEAAFTAARSGEAGTAMRHLDEADKAASKLPSDYYQPMTSFSRPIMTAHAVTVGVELRRGGEAAQHAAKLDPALIPSRPRRSRHLIEVARAHHLRGESAAALAVLDEAVATAPETPRFNGYARQIVLDVQRGTTRMRRRADDLAEKVGLLA